MGWIDRLQTRWKVGSALQVILILMVFTCTGLTVVYLMKPVLKSFFGTNVPAWASVAYYVLILPVYNIFLLLYGFIFGQFYFFWNFEKRLMRRIFSIFRKN
jgi:hypothetical protein